MIRLARFGAKKKPSYRVVVIEKEKARNGRSLEVLGFYNPLTHPATFQVKYERIAHWLSVGAKPSDTMARLLKNQPAPVVEPAAEPAA
jgi:small subunit ribosomal protein S16